MILFCLNDLQFKKNMDDEVVTFKVRGRRIKPSDVKLALSEGKVSIPAASPSAAKAA